MGWPSKNPFPRGPQKKIECSEGRSAKKEDEFNNDEKKNCKEERIRGTPKKPELAEAGLDPRNFFRSRNYTEESPIRVGDNGGEEI